MIAGSGEFPLMWARVARQLGYQVTAIAHRGETGSELENIVESVTWVRLGQLDKIIRCLKQFKIEEVAFAGGILKSRIFIDARPDFRALKILARVGARKDDSLLRAISDELESEGIRVLDSTAFLKDLLMPLGLLTARSVTPQEQKDIEIGWKIAKEIGQLDIGQCVVVKDQTILAVEAIEGSDATIERGGSLAKKGAVVIKVSKPQQDRRFDLPTVGPHTIKVMTDVGASVLALEAGTSILLEKERVILEADQAGISVIGLK